MIRITKPHSIRPAQLLQHYPLTSDKLQSVEILDRVRDTKAGTEEIQAKLVIATSEAGMFDALLPLMGQSAPEHPRITIQGTVTLPYRHYDQGWHFEGMPQNVFEFHLTPETIASCRVRKTHLF